ncbi:hypothetical protein HBI23_230140 [Parastagonospora nodorum]|nr:hypothetical protein HBH49_205180 [Parastagonospora nodorum]KAH4153366.1 hypothetical protein HBH43_225100 [Parastagonospora nodorum]KAH4319847.1 hypothetical protein HBI00_235680 [Parastagonospora nodorum]KAH4355035.1 hypothetical protein HBH94_241780 [Parastagonospora nodorum]KAH4438387.1 hypothetical protein HBH90_241300 [Parastagonospora nodorum]
MELRIYHMRANVNYIICCATCWRNVTFTDWFSTRRVDHFDVKGMDMTVAIHACCTELADEIEPNDASMVELCTGTRLRARG